MREQICENESAIAPFVAKTSHLLTLSSLLFYTLPQTLSLLLSHSSLSTTSQLLNNRLERSGLAFSLPLRLEAPPCNFLALLPPSILRTVQSNDDTNIPLLSHFNLPQHVRIIGAYRLSTCRLLTNTSCSTLCVSSYAFSRSQRRKRTARKFDGTSRSTSYSARFYCEFPKLLLSCQ